MNVGMSLLLWTTDPTDEAWLPLYERLKALGFDGLELPVYRTDEKRYAALGRRLDDLGLSRTAGTARGAHENPASPDPAIRVAGVAKNRAVLDCCQAGGMTHLAGPFYAGLGAFTGQPPTDDEWRWSLESTREIAQHAETCGVTLALEPLNRFECHLINGATDMVRFVGAVDHPRCRMMHDTFHAHIEEKDVTAAIVAAAPVLAYVHVSESDRSTPGTGQVRWGETFGALHRIGYDGWLTIEAFGQALPDLIAATKIWRRLYRDEETLAREGAAFVRRTWRENAPNGALSPSARGRGREAL